MRTLFCSEERPGVDATVTLLPEADLLDLLAQSQRQEIGPLFARELMTTLSLPEGARHAARRIYEENLARNLYLRDETRRWVERLRRAGIPCRVLKGVPLSPLLYDDLGARPSVDIDLLVHPEDRTAALALARESGFDRVFREGASPDPDVYAAHIEFGGGGAPYDLDIHWFVEGPRLVPLDHAPFWKPPLRGRDDPLAPSLVGLVLCLHLWRHAVTLKTLLDFAAFVNRFDDDVPEIRWRLRDAGAEDGLDLALILAERVLGVRSRFMPERHPKKIFLPWLDRCLRTPFAERGRYFKWLVFPLQLDGWARPVGRCVAHLVRPSARDGRLHLGSRAARLARVARRAVFSARRSGAGREDVR